MSEEKENPKIRKYFTDKEKIKIFDEIVELLDEEYYRNIGKDKELKGKIELAETGKLPEKEDFSHFKTKEAWSYFGQLVGYEELESFIGKLRSKVDLSCTGEFFFYDYTGKFKDRMEYYKNGKENTLRINKNRSKLKNQENAKYWIFKVDPNNKVPSEKKMIMDYLENEINNNPEHYNKKEGKIYKNKERLYQEMFNKTCPNRKDSPFKSYQELKEAMRERLKIRKL